MFVGRGCMSAYIYIYSNRCQLSCKSLFKTYSLKNIKLLASLLTLTEINYLTVSRMLSHVHYIFPMESVSDISHFVTSSLNTNPTFAKPNA